MSVPTLLLLHLDLLGNPDSVLRIGLRHRAVIDGLAVERAHSFAQVEDMRFRSLLGPIFRRDPVYYILTSGVLGIFGCISHC